MKWQALHLSLWALLSCGCGGLGRAKLPDYLGLFLVDHGSIIEIGKQAPPTTSDEAMFVKAFHDGPQPKGTLEFILFDDEVRPQDMHLRLLQPQWQRGGIVVGGAAVALHITPIDGKTSMYRLTPGAPAQPGLYSLTGQNLFGTKSYAAYFVFDAPAESYLPPLRKARADEDNRRRAEAEEARRKEEREQLSKTVTATLGEYLFSASNENIKTDMQLVITDIGFSCKWKSFYMPSGTSQRNEGTIALGCGEISAIDFLEAQATSVAGGGSPHTANAKILRIVPGPKWREGGGLWQWELAKRIDLSGPVDHLDIAVAPNATNASAVRRAYEQLSGSCTSWRAKYPDMR